MAPAVVSPSTPAYHLVFLRMLPLLENVWGSSVSRAGLDQVPDYCPYLTVSIPLTAPIPPAPSRRRPSSPSPAPCVRSRPAPPDPAWSAASPCPPRSRPPT